MTSLNFGFSVTPGPAIELGAEMRRAEALGYSRMGVWDSPALFREPWVTLASVARDTTTMRVGTWVTNPISRHPVVTAASLATLADLAPGRAYLGIGSGGTGVWHLGHAAAKLDDVRAYITAVQELLRDGATTFRGKASRMEWARGLKIPLIMSAHGPRALRLAGEIADGVIVGLGVSPDVVANSLALIAEGAEAAGRTLADIEVWFTCFWFVDDEPGAAMAEGAWAATAFAMHFSRGRVEGKFVPDEYRDGIAKLGEQYDLVAHGRVSDDLKRRYVDVADSLGIGEYIRSRFMFCGTPDEVATQIRTAVAAGATNFDGAIDADLDEHEQRITTWAHLVFPRLKEDADG
jgi:5,10-methylenetetrahydromethanopterin reductase